MVIPRILKGSFSLIFNLRHGLYLATVSGFYILSGCVSTVPISYTPQPVIDIVHIQPFRLEKSYKYDWRIDQEDVNSGLLVVVRVDPKLVTPVNELEPVLYAGNQTVQRLNQGDESGFVIGIIPGQIDLSKEPIWFGTPALPERIDAKTIASERANAKRSGILPPNSTDIQSRTRDMIVAPDLTTLLREYAADLILEYSPQEKHLADSWRLPETGSQK